MLKGQDIICISTIDWDFIWQGHQEIMATLARNGNRVLFIENTGVRRPNLRDLPRLRKRLYNWLHSTKGIREGGENLYIYAPLILPFPYSRVARWVNKRLMLSVLKRWIKSTEFSNPIVWTFLPTGIVMDIIDAVEPKMVIYYCIDNFSASSPQAKGIRESEKKLLKRADMVFVTAKNLYDWCSQHSKKVHTFPFGVNLNTYQEAKGDALPLPADMTAIPRPIVGYVGGIHKWIDFDLVGYLAKTHKDKSFVFVGPLQAAVDDLKTFPNVYFLGQKRYEELPAYVNNFDVCLIPYVMAEYTKNVYPTKSNEYLLMGKPVVSTAIPEIMAYNERSGGIISVGHSKEEFSSLVQEAAAQKPSDEIGKKRRRVAEEEGGWKNKIERMSNLIERQLMEKEAHKSTHWRDKFLQLYKRTGYGMVKSLAAVLAAYFLIFYTPIVWVLARPLVISDQPKKADVIVVLGGGVGESGRAGQGYEERAGYAVELYKKGYAGHIVFSSGYTYILEETLVMKALAVSLGVPENAVILENRSSNTYDSVLFTKEILSKERWNNVLLLSSPYHMLRVSKVFSKLGGDINVSYTPIPKGSFYAHEDSGFFSKKINLRQINGIIHEYVGIIYYRWKGWI